MQQSICLYEFTYDQPFIYWFIHNELYLFIHLPLHSYIHFLIFHSFIFDSTYFAT